MRRLVLLILFLCLPGWSAITERYVTSGAGGGGDGSSGSPWTFSEAVTSVTEGDRINVKGDGTYVFSADLAFAVNASATKPIIWRGYTSTIADGGDATLTFEGTGSEFYVTGHYNRFYNLVMSSTNAWDFVLRSTGYATQYFNCNVESTATSVGWGTIAWLDRASAFNCKFKAVASGCLKAVHLSKGTLFGCYVESPTVGVFLDLGNSEGRIYNCILTDGGAGSSTYGIHFENTSNRGVAAVGNTLWGWDSDGILCAQDRNVNEPSLICNNIFYNIGGYGVNNTWTANTFHGIAIFANAFGSITSGNYGGWGDNDIFDTINLSADPFTNAAGGDFTLNNTAGGGALLRATAYPTDIDLDGTQDNFLDMGPLNHEDAGGGGWFHPLAGGILP